MYNPNAKNIDFKKCRQNDEDDKKWVVNVVLSLLKRRQEFSKCLGLVIKYVKVLGKGDGRFCDDSSRA
jgi:hypothetical protein